MKLMTYYTATALISKCGLWPTLNMNCYVSLSSAATAIVTKQKAKETQPTLCVSQWRFCLTHWRENASFLSIMSRTFAVGVMLELDLKELSFPELWRIVARSEILERHTVIQKQSCREIPSFPPIPTWSSLWMSHFCQLCGDNMLLKVYTRAKLVFHDAIRKESSAPSTFSPVIFISM